MPATQRSRNPGLDQALALGVSPQPGTGWHMHSRKWVHNIFYLFIGLLSSPFHVRFYLHTFNPSHRVTMVDIHPKIGMLILALADIFQENGIPCSRAYALFYS